MNDEELDPIELGRLIKKIISGERIMPEVAEEFIRDVMLTDKEIDYAGLTKYDMMMSLTLFKEFGAGYRLEEVEHLLKLRDLKNDEFSLLERLGVEDKKIYSKLHGNILAFIKRLDRGFKSIIISQTKNNIEFLRQKRFETFLMEVRKENHPATRAEEIAYERALNEYKTGDRVFKDLSEEDREALDLILGGGSPRGGAEAVQEGIESGSENNQKEENEHIKKAEEKATARGAVAVGVKYYSDEEEGKDKVFSTHFFNADQEEVYQYGNTLEALIQDYQGTAIENREWSDDEMEELGEVHSM